jgi:hypothetical protein
MTPKAQPANRRGFLRLAGATALAKPALARGTAWGEAAPPGSTPGLPPLKITDVRVIVTCPGRNYVLLKILTSEPGLYGVGDATLNGRELAVATTLEKHLPPRGAKTGVCRIGRGSVKKRTCAKARRPKEAQIKTPLFAWRSFASRRHDVNYLCHSLHFFISARGILYEEPVS